MNNKLIALLVLAIFILALVPAAAASQPGKTVSSVCPVMGNKVPDISKAAGKSVYKGTTYYFCCAGCKAKFDKNPGQYLKPATKVSKTSKTVSAICPVTKTRIADVTKAAGKSVYKGKTYYFCCSGCKPAFDKNPSKYVKN